MKEMSFDFFRGDDVKTGGECIIIEIDQGSGGDSQSRGRGRDGFHARPCGDAGESNAALSVWICLFCLPTCCTCSQLAGLLAVSC